MACLLILCAQDNRVTKRWRNGNKVKFSMTKRRERVEENGHDPSETAFAGDREQVSLNTFFSKLSVSALAFF